MSRTRSEYRLQLPQPLAVPADESGPALVLRGVRLSDRSATARLLLDAYRGTIDDEGEGDEEALEAIDEYFSCIIWAHSFVVVEGELMFAMSFVVVVGDRHYIDPVATAASHKGRGIGRRAVIESLTSLAAAGVTEVGATITDGNTASERLFTSLGFERTGQWV
jgi:GNAT superfamily N-acetyltransferase